MEEPVIIENQNGERLFGIVHKPESGSYEQNGVGINLLNPGIKYRVAPNRLNVKIAHRLCQKGYYVLRFDPAGIGDSEGELPEGTSIPDIWQKIQMGLFVSDVIAANDYFISRYQLKRLILVGNCGGAITALLTSAQDSRIDSLCLIDVPVYLSGSKMSFADKVVPGGQKADSLFSQYTRKLFIPKSWYRFITGKTEYRAVWKILQMRLQKNSYDSSLPKNAAQLCRENSLNRRFFESFEQVVKKRKRVLFILAGNDAGTEVFQRYFRDGYLSYRNRDVSYLVRVCLIENANHIYTLTEWQESLLNKVSSWIDSQNS